MCAYFDTVLISIWTLFASLFPGIIYLSQAMGLLRLSDWSDILG